MGLVQSGRPPKSGERYPGGQLKPADGREPLSPALLRRIFRSAEEGHGDARLASQVGRLVFYRLLSAAEATTAFQVAEVYGRFEAQSGVRRSTRSPSYETGFNGGRAGDELAALVDPETIERMRTIEAAWLALQDELSDYPRRVRAAIETLCVNDEAIGSLLLPDVRKILAKLAAFFRSGRAKKRRRRSALMVVGREHRAIPIDTPAPRRIDRDKEAWLAVQRKLSPQLDERELQDAYGIFVAMKDRGRFNESQAPYTPR